MSLELRDLRAKITVETDCAIDGYAAAQDMEKGEAVREILHKWAIKQIEGAMVLQARLKREGMEGSAQGTSARAGESAP